MNEFAQLYDEENNYMIYLEHSSRRFITDGYVSHYWQWFIILKIQCLFLKVYD